MGKGDKKTARGKIWRGSYGKSRPHHSRQSKPVTRAVTGPKRKGR